jgi:anaerobic nitric oxide reductase transcription regulator
VGAQVAVPSRPQRLAAKNNPLPLRDAVDAFQRELIAHELQQADGNQAQVAARLGIDRSNLSRLMKRLGL